MVVLRSRAGEHGQDFIGDGMGILLAAIDSRRIGTSLQPALERAISQRNKLFGLGQEYAHQGRL